MSCARTMLVAGCLGVLGCSADSVATDGGVTDGTAAADSHGETPADSGGAPCSTSSIVEINFSEIGNDQVVSDQYADHALFSTDAGSELIACSDPCGQESGNFVTPDCDGNTQANAPVFVDFTRPVGALTFNAVCVNANDKFAQVRVMVGDTLAATVDIEGPAPSITQPLPIELTDIEGITRIEIVDVTDRFGVGWSDLRFLQCDS